MSYDLLKQLEIRVANLERFQSAQTEEHRFFDNPQAREVREFSDTRALSNDPTVALNAVDKADSPDRDKEKAVQQAVKAPPTVKDNLNQEASKSFSTLHRLVVETAEDEPSLPKSFKEAPKAQKVKTRREKEQEAIKLAYMRKRCK